MKKVISATILVSVLYSTMQPISLNAFKAMDVCNSTGGDFSGNYYDQKCTKDGTPSDNIKEKEDKKNNIDKNITNNVKKEKKPYNLISLKSTNTKLNYVPFWLMKGNERNARKDEQLCKIASSFDILNEDGTLKYTYYPQGCQENLYEDNNVKDSNYQDNNVEGIDKFLGNILGDNIIEDKKIKKDTLKDKKTDTDFSVNNSSNGTEFIDNIFSDTDSMSEKNNYFSSGSEDPVDKEDDGLNNTDNIDDLLNDIFSYNIDKKSISLKGSKFAKTIRDYSDKKVKIKVGAVEANVLGNVAYTSKVVKLLSQIDKEFKINSIKNDLSKNISNISFSLYTYKNTKDLETKKVFKNRLIKDLQTLKKKYAILKKKDYMISKTLEKRGKL